jgi:hypothetical protein
MNPQIPQDINSPITPGVNVTVPTAMGGGYHPPGGPAGNGIGGGSQAAGQVHGSRARGFHQTQHTNRVSQSGTVLGLPAPGHH